MFNLKSQAKMIAASVLVLTNFCSHVKADILRPHDPLAHKNMVFNVQAKGAGGVLPYFTDKTGKAYVLLSKEAGGRDKGQYCDFGGSVECNKAKNKKAKNKYDTLIDTARKECFEESVMLCNLTKSYLINNSYFYYNTNPNFRVLMGLTKIGYNPSSIFNQARAKAAKQKLPWKYIEKSDYQWVSVNSLMNCMNNNQNKNVKLEVLNSNVKNAQTLNTAGMTKWMTMNLRSPFFSSLKGLKPILPQIAIPAKGPAPVKAPVLNKAAKKAQAKKAAAVKKAQLAAKKAHAKKAAKKKK